jgi:HAD superfamily hydrolase (TIGR01490 family)
MRRAAFFDLDGTLLTVNSAASWVRRERRLGRVGKRQIARALLLFAAYRLSVLDIESAMAEALSTVKGVDEETLRAATNAWYREEIAPKAAPGGFDAIARHRRDGDRLVLLTSSSPYASACAVEQFGLDAALCTRFEVEGGVFTGRVVKPYCFGAGKVTLAEEYAAREGLDLRASAFYTDSYTDLPMLERVGRPFIVQPDPRLRWEARRRRWPVLDWRRAAGASAAG